MPITQQRMMSLINAALDYQNALDGLIDMIRASANSVRAELSTAEREIQHLELSANLKVLLVNITSPTTIAVEHSHFKSMARQNLAAAARQQRLRDASNDLRPINKRKITRRPPLEIPPDYRAPPDASTAPRTQIARNHQHGRATGIPAMTEDELEANAGMPDGPLATDSFDINTLDKAKIDEELRLAWKQIPKTES